MSCPVAIVGMACRYPDADTVEQLFENSLAQRRAFRKIPDTRLGAGYFEFSAKSKDRAYVRQAALIQGFRFDREWFRVSKSSYEVTDLAHWLALTVAHEAIEDICFRKGGRHPENDAVRVIVGNTLTGEFSRANLMRLRWPYVRRVVSQRLAEGGLDLGEAERERFLRGLETTYKSAFPTPNEDFLAGGLANTIAGRICNHFDFKGGGYSVDGACSSSLLAVIDACSALTSGDADMAVAGGVDVSLDPFELVGFSRSFALARRDMTVYDEEAEGFWPGEGCGFVVLMRYDDALEQCERIYAVIRGWGMSSDGRGGLTRPESEGQMLALRRCYTRAGFGIESVGYFEGHGTGTKVGDAAELRALMAARRESGAPVQPAVISSIKANIGHTKAAAGLAGLLRATKCVAERILAPTSACRRPHALFGEDPGNLRTLDRPGIWDSLDHPRRAGVSAMGFGGINTHVAIEEAPVGISPRATVAASAEYPLLQRFQDTELFLFAASRWEDLAWTIGHVASFAESCSLAELTDLAVEMARRATRGALSPWKAAVVAATPAELSRKLALLQETLAALPEEGIAVSVRDGVFLSGGEARGKIGLIFPGQGAPARVRGGAHARRFEKAQECYRLAGLDSFLRFDDTDFAQPAIVSASLAGLSILQELGVSGDIAIGHSLGELAALHWAGCFDAETLIAIAKARGRRMADEPSAAGAMAALVADRETTLKAVGARSNLYIANVNSPRQTVVSGDREQVERLLAEMQCEGVSGTMLPLRQSFHTPAMAGVAKTLARDISSIQFHAPERKMISTVTGDVLQSDVDVAAYLCDQLLASVDFLAAVRKAAEEADLFIEVGPGELMTNLIRGFCDKQAVSIDVGGQSLSGLLHATGAAYVLGRAQLIATMFNDRFAKRFDWSWKPVFFENPCESGAPVPETAEEPHQTARDGEDEAAPPDTHGDTRQRLRQIIAKHTGLPTWTLLDGSRMLSDLHLNSITVGEIVTRLTASMSLPTPLDPTEYADASIASIAEAMDAWLESSGPSRADSGVAPAGIGSWVRTFKMTRVPAAQLEAQRHLKLGKWEGFGAIDNDAAGVLSRLNVEPHRAGVIVWVGRSPNEEDLPALLRAAQGCINLARQSTEPVSFVVVQPGWGASGFARSFFVENSSIRTLVINCPHSERACSAEQILGEIDAASQGFREVFLTSNDGREEMRLSLTRSVSLDRAPLIDSGDIVLVSGGGKGISAECGYQLALQTGCALLILGRSTPQESIELASNLDRLRVAGVKVSYQSADVTDRAAVSAAVARGCAELGGLVTAVIHGAGLNLPRTIANLSLDDVLSTIAPKIRGFHNLIAALDPRRLKLVANFSSIIARIGLRGEADYALANEWLSRLTEEFQSSHPNCRCRAIEWSVWSGVGMGQRLGRLDILAAQGISPISTDEGVREFLKVIESPELPVRVIVSGRFGWPPTIEFDLPRPARFRFIETIAVYYPGVELIAECTISRKSDPYLDGHALNGERLLPAVMALEALTQAAHTLVQLGDEVSAPIFTEVKFRKAIVVPNDPDQKVTLRVVTLAREDEQLSFALRCSTTSFQVNHVEARGVLRDRILVDGNEFDSEPLPAQEIRSFDPNRSLYENVLFQTGRFKRIRAFHLIEARRCSASFSASDELPWFSQAFSQTCVLGDPGARDAALHAIQVCIPHKVVIPIGVAEINCGVIVFAQAYRMLAREVADTGEELKYGLTIIDQHGRVQERWRGLTLRVVGERSSFRLDSPELAAPFFERQIASAMPQAGLKDRMARVQTETRVRMAGTRPDHRSDGKLDPANGCRFRSVAYSRGWKLTTDGKVPLGCDLQDVLRKEAADWRALLGLEAFRTVEAVSDMIRESLSISATRVWTAREAMKKMGLAATAPILVDPASTKRWVIFKSGNTAVFSSTIDTAAREAATCVAVAIEGTDQDRISENALHT
jgi:enediyne polyketide synthase